MSNSQRVRKQVPASNTVTAVPPPQVSYGRARSNSGEVITGRLRSASELHRQGLITEDEKALIKSMIVSRDPKFREEFDRARNAGDWKEIKELLKTCVLPWSAPGQDGILADLSEVNLDGFQDDDLSAVFDSSIFDGFTDGHTFVDGETPPLSGPLGVHTRKSNLSSSGQGLGPSAGNTGSIFTHTSLAVPPPEDFELSSLSPTSRKRPASISGTADQGVQKVLAPTPVHSLKPGNDKKSRPVDVATTKSLLTRPPLSGSTNKLKLANKDNGTKSMQRGNSGGIVYRKNGTGSIQPTASIATPPTPKPNYPPSSTSNANLPRAIVKHESSDTNTSVNDMHPTVNSRIGSTTAKSQVQPESTRNTATHQQNYITPADQEPPEYAQGAKLGEAKSRKNERERRRRLAVSQGFDKLNSLLRPAGEDKNGRKQALKVDKATILRNTIQRLQHLEERIETLDRENRKLREALKE